MSKTKQRKRPKNAVMAYESNRYKIFLRSLILTGNDEQLHSPCLPVDCNDKSYCIDSDIERIKAVLRATKNGVGLAANQIGIMKRIIAVWPDRRNMMIFVNPSFFSGHICETATENEGCLSYPGIVIPVERPSWGAVSYSRLYRDGEVFNGGTERVDGMTARIIQHEIDHLDGKCALREHWEASK